MNFIYEVLEKASEQKTQEITSLVFNKHLSYFEKRTRQQCLEALLPVLKEDIAKVEKAIIDWQYLYSDE
jgi:hypothetical protein